MKKLIYSISLLLASHTLQAQSIYNGQLLHYPFNLTTRDASGNNNHGTGNVVYVNDRFGNPNQAAYFNGSTSYYIDLTNNPALKPSLPVSISMWVKFDNNDPLNSNVFCTDFGQDSHAGVWVSRSAAGNLAVNYGDNTGNTSSANRRTKIGSTAIQPNVWYHVAVVVNGPTDMEIYINCNNDGGMYDGSGGPLAYSSVPGSVGRKDTGMWSPPNYFKGAVDEIRYWNRALNASDINALCNNILSVSEKKDELTAITLFPNPAATEIFIEGLNNLKPTKYSIINALGQVLVEKAIIAPSVNISELPKGVYILKLEDGISVKNMKFMKD